MLGPVTITAGGRAVSESEVSTAPSFRRFYDAEFRDVYAYLHALTGDRWVAEDLAQETFARAYRDWATVSGYDRPGAWARTVAHNLAVSRLRRLASEARAVLRLRGMRQPDVAALEPEDEAFWAEVRRLPERQAQAVVLHYVEDLPVAEIAAIMGTAEGTTKVHLHRARRTLADRLGLEPEGDGR